MCIRDSNERLGPLIECLDVMVIVFGVCRDIETYTSDEKGGEEDEVALFTISIIISISFNIPYPILQIKVRNRAKS